MKKLSVGVLALGMLLTACDDDDDDDVIVDAGLRDAGALPDTGVADAGPMDDAGADAVTFAVPLTVEEEVPACEAAGAGAEGSATVLLEGEGEETAIVVRDLTFENLSGPPAAAHIHFGQPGEAGPIVLPFDELTPPVDQTFTAEDYPEAPPEEAPETFEGFVEAVRMGETYINVHTEACPPGEIRGQID